MLYIGVPPIHKVSISIHKLTIRQLILLEEVPAQLFFGACIRVGKYIVKQILASEYSHHVLLLSKNNNSKNNNNKNIVLHRIGIYVYEHIVCT